MGNVGYVDCPYCGATNGYANKDIMFDGSINLTCSRCHEPFSIVVGPPLRIDTLLPIYDLEQPQTAPLPEQEGLSSEIVKEDDRTSGVQETETEGE